MPGRLHLQSNFSTQARHWLQLSATPGLGPAALGRLRAAFGTGAAILGQSVATLTPLIGSQRAAALAQSAARGLEDAPSLVLEWLAGTGPRALLCLEDAPYPRRLLDLADAPPILYVRGDPARLAQASIAVVGSRQASASGLDHAYDFARTLAALGLSIVSGLARGIDGAAHTGALAGGAGATTAFVGTGIDRVYPPRHHALAQAIVDGGGAIASEFALGTPALAAHFPRRNRLIAAASLGVLVVEANAQSGSLITARQALELGREVFAIPGPIRAEHSRGCHALLRAGAKLVESVTDILDELPALAPQRDAHANKPPSPEAAALPTAMATAEPAGAAPGPGLGLLGWEATTLDQLLAHSESGAASWLARLTQWELAGTVTRLADGRWQRLR